LLPCFEEDPHQLREDPAQKMNTDPHPVTINNVKFGCSKVFNYVIQSNKKFMQLK